MLILIILSVNPTTLTIDVKIGPIYGTNAKISAPQYRTLAVRAEPTTV